MNSLIKTILEKLDLVRFAKSIFGKECWYCKTIRLWPWEGYTIKFKGIDHKVQLCDSCVKFISENNELVKTVEDQ